VKRDVTVPKQTWSFSQISVVDEDAVDAFAASAAVPSSQHGLGSMPARSEVPKPGIDRLALLIVLD
jgi:hypothetical protein